ncbi:MAG: ATP-binding protein [bacterium]|nr:ATP-binding protein [bacterium]
MPKERYLTDAIANDLREKMVFLGGPRQVGKTTLAKTLGVENYPVFTYLNWDNRAHRKDILSATFESHSKLVIFDEIHKYSKWKNYVKGEFDVHNKEFDILVTGSARLDTYRRGGDSLMGRYHYYRLHPFSLAESAGLSYQGQPGDALTFSETTKRFQAIFAQLYTYGGFPEPFIKKNDIVLRRFHNDRLERLVKEDIRDLEAIRDLSSLEILVSLLPPKVGSLLSLESLREDVEVNHKTLTHWMNILERFYYHFRITPFHARTIQSLRKTQKMYLWDWSEVPDLSARLENIVASHLLKFTHFLYDTYGHAVSLHFLRDRAGREVDFLVAYNKKPWFAVEVKQSQREVSSNLLYFKEKLGIPFLFQVSHDAVHDRMYGDVRMMNVETFLSAFV